MDDNIFARARIVSIESILDRLGAKWSKGRGTKHLYHCPFREDKNPSLYVNTEKGTWVDMANPGDLKGDGIKLVQLTLNLRPFEAAKYIVGDSTAAINETLQKREKQTQRAESTKFSVSDLQHPALLAYMSGRGISEKLAKRLCREIHIGNLFYVGFPSQSGGYELRNKYSKRSLGNKDISVLGTGSKAMIFEGFIDMLSHLQIFRIVPDCKYIVLNSTCNVGRVIEHFNTFGMPQKLELWLDNDKSGREAAALVFDNIYCEIEDKSSVYAPYNDVNEWLTESNKSN